jgi:hypothetical protein
MWKCPQKMVGIQFVVALFTKEAQTDLVGASFANKISPAVGRRYAPVFIGRGEDQNA